MKCQVCGCELEKIVTTLPFKIGPETIVIVKNLPVTQCGNCREYLIEDGVMARVETILEHAGGDAELEVVRYAA